MLKSEKIKIEHRYYSLAYKADISQNFQPSKNYPNGKYKRAIYCLEDVYEEVRWSTIRKYLRYKEGIDLREDVEENYVYELRYYRT